MSAPWPDPPADAALYGLAGDVVRTLGPHSEADPAAILFQLLAAFGSAVGRSPHYRVEGDRHHANLFVAIVGDSSKGRKGTSWGRIKDLMTRTDEAWASRIISGLSSGEGLTWQVRDPITSHEPVKQGGRVVDYQDVVTDPGVTDKRLMVVEGEMASVLRVMGREGNTLSATIRNAWDSGTLRTTTKGSPAVATNAHVAIVGHVTADELRRYLDRTEAGNGFANRFLFVCARRSKVLPFGGALEESALADLADRVSDALTQARRVTFVAFGEGARSLWVEKYPELSEGAPGLLGAVTGRAEAQTVRLALLYALLDGSFVIERQHLQAGLAAWEYAERSAAWIFGDAVGDSVANAIRAALHRAGRSGMTRTEISAIFGRHASKETLDSALKVLADGGLAVSVANKGAGRPTERWFATEAVERHGANFADSLSSQPAEELS